MLLTGVSICFIRSKFRINARVINEYMQSHETLENIALLNDKNKNLEIKFYINVKVMGERDIVVRVLFYDMFGAHIFFLQFSIYLFKLFK